MRIEAAARCDVLIGGTGYARCHLPTSHTIGDKAVCVHHLGYGGALPFTAEDMKGRLLA